MILYSAKCWRTHVSASLQWFLRNWSPTATNMRSWPSREIVCCGKCVLLFPTPYRVESLMNCTGLMLEWTRWSGLSEAMCGSPNLTSTLRTLSNCALHAKAIGSLLHFSPGLGLPSPGNASMLILPGHFWTKCFSLWMHTRHGQKFWDARDEMIRVLRHLFASYGLQCQLVSNNSPQFCSEEFATFLKANGVRHINCASYHPASNGLVEHFVRTFKQALKAHESSSLQLQYCLASFLFGIPLTQLQVVHPVYCSWKGSCIHAWIYWGQIVRTMLSPSSSTKCSIMTNMPNLSNFRLDSVWWPTITDLVHGGVLQWSRHVLALALCCWKPTSLRLGSVIMINCTQPMWQQIRHQIRVMMSWCWIIP